MPTTPTPVEIFGRRFKEARINADLSQKDVHEKTGIAISFISGVEGGYRNISIERAGMLAEAVNQPLYKLLMP